MDMKNCSRCGKLYATSNPSLCPDCVDKDQVDFRKVRDFVKENPEVSIEVICEATGVDEIKILEYIRQGHLVSADLRGPAIECVKCGKSISKGRYCVLCQQEIQKSFGSGKSGPQKKSQDDKEKKESFIDRYKKR